MVTNDLSQPFWPCFVMVRKKDENYHKISTQNDTNYYVALQSSLKS